MPGFRVYRLYRLVPELLRHHGEVFDLPRVLLEHVGKIVVELDYAIFRITTCYEDICAAQTVRHLRGLEDQVERDAQENDTAQGQRVDD